MDYIDSKTIPEDETILFMGDINIGPGGGDRYVADFPDSFAVFTDAGLVSTVPNAESATPFRNCCADRRYNARRACPVDASGVAH